MNSTRLTTVITFVLATVGLVMLSMDNDLVMIVPGAMLVVGSAIALVRHFWRESDRKRKQESAANAGATRAAISKLSQDSSHVETRLRSEVAEVSKRVEVFTQGVLEYVAQLELDLRSLMKDQQATDARLRKGLDQAGQHLDRRLDRADRLANKRRDSIVVQVSSVLGLYHRFKPDAPFPPFGGWAIGGECAHLLVNSILLNRPRWIVEAGSGLSTVLAAKAMDLVGRDGHIISLEHEEKWLGRTQFFLDEQNLNHRSTLVHAPLVETKIGEELYSWYDLSSVDLPDDIGLIFIDGPPEATGPMARYPALPLLYENLIPGGVIIMDDATRDGEMAAINRWKAEYPDLEFEIYSDSKGTVEITKSAE